METTKPKTIKVRNRAGIPLFPLLFNIVFKALAGEIRQDDEMADLKNRRRNKIIFNHRQYCIIHKVSLKCDQKISRISK